MYIIRHTYVLLYIHTYGNIHTYDCTYSCMFISLQHIHTYACTCTWNFISICTYVRTPVLTHIRSYIQIHLYVPRTWECLIFVDSKHSNLGRIHLEKMKHVRHNYLPWSTHINSLQFWIFHTLRQNKLLWASVGRGFVWKIVESPPGFGAWAIF